MVTMDNVTADAAPKDSPYQVLADGYAFDGYDRLPVFCSFLPGVGGPHGAPLWAMYLNRGQGVISFGMQDKDHAVMEFYAATASWQLAPLYGFRTFVRTGGRVWEPFGADGRDSATRRMTVRRHALRIEESNPDSGLAMSVEYVSVAGSLAPALVRSVTIRNISDTAKDIELLDGMPVIVPAGINDFALKKLRRIMEAFCRASRFEDEVVLFAPPVSTEDAAEVTDLKDASFYGAWQRTAGGLAPLPLVVDPDSVFGAGSDFIRPRVFEAPGRFSAEGQNWANRLPCAFAHAAAVLAPGAELRIEALAGFTRSQQHLSALLKEAKADFGALHAAAERCVDDILQPAQSATSSPALDGYILQNHLDNILRGGLPVLFPSADGDQVVHLYTRRHGDMERDYNDFHLPPFPYSEGSGNFRDILQNRRNDVYFHPESGLPELRYFLSILQPDGYNPLAIEGCRWFTRDAEHAASLVPAGVSAQAAGELATILKGDFSAGQLCLWAANHAIPDADRAVRTLLAQCPAKISAKPSHEGYWVDHWIYLLDMLEAYEGVFPDRIASLLEGGAEFAWAPCTHGLVRKGSRFHLEELPRPATLPAASLLVRLSALAAAKALTLDREGRGIEMEAGRPGWNDAMNGLPGLDGSSVCETAALLRLCEWVLPRIANINADQQAPAVLAELFTAAETQCGAAAWNHAGAVAAREQYRAALYAGEKRDPATVSPTALRRMWAAIEQRCTQALAASRTADGELVHTYFRREKTGDGADRAVALPLFLEGQVHLLRLGEGRSRAREITAAVRRSPLFDQALRMYRLNESLADHPYSIGRARTFSPGVYENESIWLHMSYKYLVELLRCGLHRDFFADCKTMLVPFMDPAVYGRSILENSSFIGSSACIEKAMRGRGYVARLSGSTAEFIHLWLLMTVGDCPFRVDQGTLTLGFNPALPGEWFRARPSTITLGGSTHNLPADTLATAFLGKVLLVFHNPKRADTFGPGGVRPLGYTLDGTAVAGAVLRGEAAESVRSRAVRRVDIHLG